MLSINTPRASLWQWLPPHGWELAGFYLTRARAHRAARLYRWSHPQHLWAVRPCGPQGEASPPRLTPVVPSFAVALSVGSR